MSNISNIGSGNMAAAIGRLAAKSGHTIEVVSRDAAKARSLAERIGDRAKTGSFGGIPNGDIVILAVPYFAVIDVVMQYGENLAGKLLVDITNPVAADLKSFVTPGNSFGAPEIARAAPANAVVVKAFNTHFSHVIAADSFQEHPLDVFIASDNTKAKARVTEFVGSLGLHAMDTRLLHMARTLEHLCLLSLGLLSHSIKHTNFSIRVSLPA